MNKKIQGFPASCMQVNPIKTFGTKSQNYVIMYPLKLEYYYVYLLFLNL